MDEGKEEFRFPESQFELLLLCQKLAKTDVESCLAGISKTDPELIDTILNPTSSRVDEKGPKTSGGWKRAFLKPKKRPTVLKAKMPKKKRRRKEEERIEAPVHVREKGTLGLDHDEDGRAYIPIRPVSRRVFKPPPEQQPRRRKGKNQKRKKKEEGFNLRWQKSQKPTSFEAFKKKKRKSRKKQKKKGRVLKVAAEEVIVKKRRKKKRRLANIHDKAMLYAELKARLLEQRKKTPKVKKENERIQQRRKYYEKKRTPSKPKMKLSPPLALEEELSDGEEVGKGRSEPIEQNFIAEKPNEEPVEERAEEEPDEVAESETSSVTSSKIEEARREVEEDEEALRFEREINNARLFEYFDDVEAERLEIYNRLNMVRNLDVPMSANTSLNEEMLELERRERVISGELIIHPKSVIDEKTLREVNEYKQWIIENRKRETGDLSSDPDTSKAKLIEVLAEGILDDLIEEVSKEAMSVGDETVEKIFDIEFKV